MLNLFAPELVPDFSDELISRMDVPLQQMDPYYRSLDFIAIGLPTLWLLSGLRRFWERRRPQNVINGRAALQEASWPGALLKWRKNIHMPSTYIGKASSIMFIGSLRPLVLASMLSAVGSFQLGATMINVNYDEMSSQVQDATTTSFDAGMNLPSGFSVSGVAQVGDTSVMNRFLAPTGDHTNYAWVGAGSILSYMFKSPVDYFGLYWGSPDTYNQLVLTDVNGSSSSFSPNQGALTDLKADQSTAAYVGFFNTGKPWASVTFKTLGPAFEFDSLASEASSTPEPAGICLIGVGLVTLGTFRRGKTFQSRLS